MNAKRTIRKILALGAGVTMVGATIMGAMAYDLANYPTPFITDGVYKGAIVLGSTAKMDDLIGAVDIATSLQALSVSKKAVEVPGAAGEVSLGENAFKFESGNDMLEIREAMGNVYDSLTDSELPALAGGTITTDEGTTDYNQYLKFDDGTGTTLQPIGVNYAENKADMLGDYLVIDNDESFFEWEIVFNEGLESALEGTAPSQELVDLEDESFNIFGTEYTFVNSDFDSTNDEVTLEFMTGDISATLKEGETKTFTLNGVEYAVTLIFVSDPNTGDAEAKFQVNGETTDSMQDGDTDTLSGGVQIGVRDLLVNSRDGVVQFFLGADKISFFDPEYDDNSYGTGSSIEIGNEDIDDAEVMIDVTENSATSAQINSIKYKLQANPSAGEGSVFYIPSGKGVREFMEEPQALLSPTFDIRYEGLKTVATNPIDIDATGDDQYEITVTNMQNKEFSWPLFSAKDGVFRFGEEEDSFVFAESGFADIGAGTTTAGTVAAIAGVLNTSLASAVAENHTNALLAFNIYQDDYFVLSDIAKNEKAITYVLTYDSISTSENTVTFSDLAGGRYTIQYTALAGTADGAVLGYSDKLRVGGNTYNVWIWNNESVDYPVAVDLSNDGFLGVGTEAGFTAKGGGIIDFSLALAGDVAALQNMTGHGRNIGDCTGDWVQMRLQTLDTEFDTSGLGNENVTWNVTCSAADEEVSIGNIVIAEPTYLTGAANYNDVNFLEEDGGDISHTYTSYGAYLTLDDPSDDPETLTIEYPDMQVGAQVFVVAGTVERSESGAGGVTADQVNPIAVGLAVLDKDAPAVGSENMIVVGGPCVNSVAAELMGNPVECTEGFAVGEAMIKSFEKNGKVAILVAGYNPQDTVGASQVLANYADYPAFKGSEVKVVVPDLSSITVTAVTQ